MARNKGLLSASAGAFFDLLIGLGNTAVRAFQAAEQAELDRIKIKRTKNLIKNTNHIMQNRRSLMRSRAIMDELRLQRINQIDLDNLTKQARLQEIIARTRMMNARTAMLNAVSPANNPDAEFDGAVVNACRDCGSYQSRDLGDTCTSCGGSNLTPQHLEVRN